MTIQTDQSATTSGTPVSDAEFDLDVSVVESGPLIAELLRLTDDNCGTTCESACTSCG